jgi:phage head maturation protease/uncharacterized protein (UPF0297 family)
MGKTYDFSGWATRANLLCSDGRIIREDAFKHCDGLTVPLVWNHRHNDPNEVLGHALLENRKDGVYAYCTFNDTESGQTAKLLVQHGDVNQLSIYANKLKQQGCNVIHGAIREVSLVLAGANPGAYIESVMMHGDECDEEAIVFTGEFIENIEPLFHADTEKKGEPEMAEETKKANAENDSEETVADVFDTLSEKQKTVVYAMIGQALEDAANEKSENSEKEEEEEVKHADSDDSEETVADVFNTLSEKQKTVVYAMIGQALEDAENEKVEHSEGGANEMKHNVFEQETTTMDEVLTHSEMAAIFEDAKRCGSLREAVIAHGIEDIDVLFPDNKAINNEPGFIKRNDDWVAKVLGGVHHTPFSRIKSVFADVTKEQARAKGYTKGNLKVEEVFKLLKRVTNPTTVYKKQKLDRDDMLDINDFNILPWLKGELRMMLNEELARAVLIGDGRDPVEEADDKIDEECIRPIWKMEDLFTVKVAVAHAAGATDDEKANAFIKACVKSRKNYQGSGNPSMFMSEDMLSNCLLLEDKNGRVIYDTVEKLAARLRVREIIPVPVMENVTRTDDDTSKVYTLAGIYVNLQDYNVGTDKGGEINMFDDFDIDYNQHKYLMETRCSGSLTRPHSAVAIEFVVE